MQLSSKFVEAAKAGGGQQQRKAGVFDSIWQIRLERKVESRPISRYTREGHGKVSKHEWEGITSHDSERETHCRPFSGKYLHCKEEGVYSCIVCENVLFTSDQKFHSNCGWPSFSDVIGQGKVTLVSDTAHCKLSLKCCFEMCCLIEAWSCCRHATHRGSVQSLWRASGPRFRRRTETDSTALLRQQRLARLQASHDALTSSLVRRMTSSNCASFGFRKY